MSPPDTTVRSPRAGWPLYIFDLDGTLALIDHRRPILDDKSDSNRWKKFYAACADDTQNLAVMKTLHTLWGAGSDVMIWSGRSDEVRGLTEFWLDLYLGCPVQLKMRAEGDYTPDEDLKLSWYGELSNEDKGRLIAVFDDRDKVVAMWRRIGVACFQVADGGF